MGLAMVGIDAPVGVFTGLVTTPPVPDVNRHVEFSLPTG